METRSCRANTISRTYITLHISMVFVVVKMNGELEEKNICWRLAQKFAAVT
jgi:hypothetical protein